MDKGQEFSRLRSAWALFVTRDEIPDPGKLQLWLEVNGTRRQQGSTENLIFNVPYMIAYISEFMMLNPGDIIATGTPAGVGAGHKPDPISLKDGDRVSLGIEGLGTQTQRVVSWDKRLARGL
jgi:2,4-didehydro-3-deoxy-L-rhamnonate hydrolase